MFFFIGLFVVIGSVLGGYIMHHGKLSVLWQPSEFVIIFGAAIGSFIISNPTHTLKMSVKGLKTLVKGAPYKQKDFVELLVFLFSIFKLIKTKGMLEMESHIENPHDSELFKQYPSVHHNHHAIEFFCDYMRVMTMGVDNHYHMEELMDKELELHHHEAAAAAGAMAGMGEAMPALGIVAAVLGVITTMQSITEPPEILGGLIGAALVGTFSGVLLSYGIITPMATFMGKYFETEGKYLECIKAGFISHMQGNAPLITIEFVRKIIPTHLRPTFKEVENAINGNNNGG